jgi:hypothetical protein
MGMTTLLTDQTWDDRETGLMVPNGKINPKLAHKMVEGLKIDVDEVRRMSSAEAVRRLQPLVPMLRGKPTRDYARVVTFVDKVLGQNYKTAKKHLEEPTEVMGFNLAPHLTWWQHVGRHWDVSPVNLCVGSSSECRKTCLVNCGQNAADAHNDAMKLARTSWLLIEPEACARLLVDAVNKHGARCRKNGLRPFTRLNVLSDVPWELVFPELFTEFCPDMEFYDYTKVPDRVVPSNYDLTFSYSGHNLEYCDHEIDEHGRRVAAVFLCKSFEVVRYSDLQVMGEFKTKDQAKRFMRSNGMQAKGVNKDDTYYTGYVRGVFPQVCMGLEVVDGDVSDVRPLDPAPCLVGLTYKTPKVRQESKGGSISEVKGAEGTAFLVDVQVLGGNFVCAQVPRELNGHEAAEEADRLPAGATLPVVG